jgi:hypothetical protein
MRPEPVVVQAKKLLPLCAVLGAVGLFFLPLLLDGTTFYAFDALSEYWPWRGMAGLPAANNPLLTDPIVGFYPPSFYLGHLHYQNELRAGGPAFWNPAILGGLPYQHYLSPIHYLIFGLLPLTVAHDVLLYCGLSLVGLFAYLWLRRLGVGALAGVFGALAFSFNGYLMAWFEFEHILALAAALVGSLYFCERFLASRTWTAALAIALCLSEGIAVAHPQYSIFLVGFLVCYFAWRLWASPPAGEPPRPRRPLVLGFGLALCTSAVLASGYLFQNLDQIVGSGRRPWPFSQLFRQTGALPFSYLLTLVFPDFYGNPTLGWAATPRPLPPQPYNNYTELCIYAGVPTLVLALTGLRLCRQKGVARFFAGGALLTLLLAGGTWLYYPIATLVPGMGLTTPTRVLFLFGFCIACLATLSLDQLLSGGTPGERRGQLVAPLAMLALAASTLGVLLAPGGPAWLWHRFMGAPGAEHPERMATHFAPGGTAFAGALPLLVGSALLTLALGLVRRQRWRLLCGGALTLLLLVDLLDFGWSYNTRSPRAFAYPSTPALRFVQRDPGKFRVMSLAPFFLDNSLAPFGIEDAGGYASFFPRRYAEYVFLSQSEGGELPAEFPRWCSFHGIGSPLLDVLNVKYVLMPKLAQVPERHFRLVYEGEAQVYENLQVFPRAFFVPRAQVIPDHDRRLRTLRTFSRADFRRTVIVEEDVSPADPAPASEGEPGILVRIARYEPDAVELRVAGAGAGFVVLSDNYHPDWRAWVDGRPTEILRANHIMRAVPVGPGSHVVTMRFRASREIAGLLVSNLGWLALALVVAIGVVRRRRARAVAAGA